MRICQDELEEVRQLVAPIIRAMIDLQLATGMRASEICSMRSMDIVNAASGPGARAARWQYWLKGESKSIPLGPESQAILRPLLVDDLDQRVFPDESTYRDAIARVISRQSMSHWGPDDIRQEAIARFRHETVQTLCDSKEVAAVVAGFARYTNTDAETDNLLRMAENVIEHQMDSAQWIASLEAADESAVKMPEDIRAAMHAVRGLDLTPEQLTDYLRARAREH